IPTTVRVLAGWKERYGPPFEPSARSRPSRCPVDGCTGWLARPRVTDAARYHHACARPAAAVAVSACRLMPMITSREPLHDYADRRCVAPTLVACVVSLMLAGCTMRAPLAHWPSCIFWPDMNPSR